MLAANCQEFVQIVLIDVQNIFLAKVGDYYPLDAGNGFGDPNGSPNPLISFFLLQFIGRLMHTNQ